MIAICLAGSLLAAAAPAAVREERAVRLIVNDRDGNPVKGLTAADVVVLENGVARRVTACEPDVRPLTLAVVIDTSAAVEAFYRLDLLKPIALMLERLPVGSRFVVWATGERPTKLVEATDDSPLVKAALERVVPSGGSTLFDTLDEAFDDLKQREGSRSAMLIVTALGIEHSSRELPNAVREPARRGTAVVFAVEIHDRPMQIDTDASATNTQAFEQQSAYARTLDALTTESGGWVESLISATAVEGRLTVSSEISTTRTSSDIWVTRPFRCASSTFKWRSPKSRLDSPSNRGRADVSARAVLTLAVALIATGGATQTPVGRRRARQPSRSVWRSSVSLSR